MQCPKCDSFVSIVDFDDGLPFVAECCGATLKLVIDENEEEKLVEVDPEEME